MMAQSDEYEIGYRMPPRQTRFKKGQSGNPSGKPKKVLTHEEIVTRELDKKVTITENGKTTRVTKREVMNKAMINKAMKADLKAYKMVKELDQASRPAVQDAQEEVPRFTLVFPEEEERLRARLLEENPDWTDDGLDEF